MSVVPDSFSVVENQLELAGRFVDQCQFRDSSVIDLREKLGVRSVDQPTVSGFSDNDYPNLSSLGLSDVRDTVPIRVCPLPQELRDQFAHMQCSCTMGLFPEVSRAWVAVDSDLFVWNYESGTDLAYFDQLSHTILAVGLVPPKPSIFQPTIRHLLCIATAVDIVLLAVSFSSASDFLTAEMNLLPDFVFKVPSDGAAISEITSTRTGRIFLAARDGCLYELDYHDKGWFGRKCRKINHSKGIMSYLVPSFVNFTFGEHEPLAQVIVDETRNVLYTRSENGSLQVFDLGADGAQTGKVCSISAQQIQHYASNIAQAVERSNFRPVVHISVVPSTQSTLVTLVGVTHQGIRLYFSCFNNDMAGYTDLNATRPVTLRLVHVRLPPGFNAGSVIPRPHRVHHAHCSGDLSVLVSSVDDENDQIWALSSSNFAVTPILMEAQTVLAVSGCSWSVCESAKNGLSAVSALACALYPRLTLPQQPQVLVTQHLEAQRQILVLSVQGVHILERLRPIDSLVKLLREKNVPSQHVANFVQLHGPDETVAMCLVVACSISSSDAQVAEAAVRAYFVYGGDAQMVFPFDATQTSVLPDTSLPTTAPFSPVLNGQRPRPFPTQSMDGAYQSQQNLSSPALSTSMLQLPQQQGEPEVKFSSRHNALYIYFSRIIGRLWNMRIISEVTVCSASGKTQTIPSSSFKSDELAMFLDHLRRLKDFIDRHSLIAQSVTTKPGGGNVHQRMLSFMRPDSVTTMSQVQQQLARKYQNEAAAQERRSLTRLYDLVGRCIEAVGLWKTLADHQFHLVVGRLPQEVQDALKNMNFRQFVVYGKNMCADLCTCLTSLYLGDGAQVDAVAMTLRSACPSLYTADDATTAKASELLHVATATQDSDIRANILHDALRLYKQVAESLNLTVVCQQFEEVLFFDGIVELALCAAQKSDTQELGLYYYKNRDVTGELDTDAKRAYDKRIVCYRCIVDALDRLLSAGSARDPRLMPNLVEYFTELMLKQTFDSNDELCHVAMFEWMMQKNLNEKLLTIKSPYLESYLHAAVKQGGPDVVQHFEMLWRYYERNQQYLQAAKLLEKLADMHSTSIDLAQRLNYLTRAVVCAKSCDSDIRGQYLQELEDRLEVANEQKKLADCLREFPTSTTTQQAIAKLNAELFDISRLYAEFAEEFDLSECKLSIVHCAGYQDQDASLVETLWGEIIEKQLQNSGAESADTQMFQLSAKLCALGALYARRPRYFPEYFLATFLIRKAFENGFTPAWPTETLLKIGSNCRQILNALNSLIKCQDPMWRTNRRARNFLLQCALHFFNAVAEKPAITSSIERKRFATLCLDCIAALLVELQSHSATREIVELQRRFQAAQANLLNI